MTDRLQLTWPDPRPFAGRDGRPVRLLAVSDEPDHALESEATRRALGAVDLVVGCGDLEPGYLDFLAGSFGVPLLYVRGNHDVGGSWAAGERHLPAPLRDGNVHVEDGLRLLAFSGSPRYAPHGRPGAEQQVSAIGMWRRVLGALPGAVGRGPLLLVTHAAPRGLNDAPDHAHRGFGAFRWLADRLRPPLWLHGHTSLVRRGIDARCVRHGGTLLVNVTGATLVELRPPATA
ncbi:MAG: metallophosphoesterase family protein [Candidatus Limnocylindria bacterium]